MHGPQARRGHEPAHDETGIPAPHLGVGDLPAGQPLGGQPCVFSRELDAQEITAGRASRPR